MKSSQKGFGVIELLLITIIVLLVGFIGYYVYNTKNQTDKTDKAASSVSNTAANNSTSSGPYLGWNTYTSTAEPKLSFKYPKDWTLSKDGTDYAGVDSITVKSPAGTEISYGAGPAGYGGECSDSDQIIITYSKAIATAKGLYVVQWHGNNDGSFVRSAVVAYGPDSSDAPKVASFKGCIYPNQFKSHSKEYGLALAIVSDTYKDTDSDTVVKILGSLSY